MRFAIIENNKVVNIVEANQEFATENGWVEITDQGIGWTYVDNEFSPPDAPTPQKKQSVSKMEFLVMLNTVLGKPLVIQLLGSATEFSVIYSAATKIDYDDVFIGIDGDIEDPSYTAQLLYTQVITQQQVTDLNNLWPTE